MKRPGPIREHLAGFLACYVAVIIASAASASFMSYTASTASNGGMIHSFFTFLMALAAFSLAASVLALPAMTIAYPLAVVLARLLVTPIRTAVAGAILGPLVGIAATLLFFFLTTRPGPTSTIEQAIFLLPISSAAGAAMGWTVATLQRKKQAGFPPDAK